MNSGRVFAGNHQNKVGDSHAANWINVSKNIEFGPLVQSHVHRMRHGDEQQSVTICWCTRYGLQGQVPTGARVIVDNDRLAKPLRERLAYEACCHVGATASRHPHDQAHWPGRIGFCPPISRYDRQRGRTCNHVQNASATKFHWRALPERLAKLHQIGVLPSPLGQQSRSVAAEPPIIRSCSIIHRSESHIGFAAPPP
jgi:hypothetical protein